ncbi:MAG: alpha-hydroxy-acid oxidizing protein [Opitutales bacterium]
MEPPSSQFSAPTSTLNLTRQLERYRQGRSTANVQIPYAVEELEARARALMSPEHYDWVAGAAGNDDAARENLAAFARWKIVPHMLANVDARDYSVELFGRKHPYPVLIAPIGVQKAAHEEGEKATARAASRTGLTYTHSTVSTYSMEECVEAAPDVRRWFQLYWPAPRVLTESFLNRAENADYEALVVTLDTQLFGWRESNLQCAFLPFLKTDGIRNYLTDPVFRGMLEQPPEENPEAAIEKYFEVYSDKSRTFADLAELRELTNLPILLKGIQHPDDARAALDADVDGLVVSNHGGRQVAGGIATSGKARCADVSRDDVRHILA